MDKLMNAEQLAKYVGECWGGNSEKFIECFSEDGVIEHPFFSEPISPKTAIEVLNSTVKVNTKYNKYTLLKGNGDGVDDVIRMEFIDAGTNAGYIPTYHGNMIIDAWIKNHKFTKFKAYGYDVIKNDNIKEHEFKHYDFPDMNYEELSQELADAWMNNDMDKFVSLFSEDAVIYHPILSKPATPREVADVINSGTEGISILRKPKLIKGDGSGKKDTVDLYFEETGDQLGYIPDQVGLMHITAEIKDNKFTELVVHGYTPIKNKIDINELEKIFKHDKVFSNKKLNSNSKK